MQNDFQMDYIMDGLVLWLDGKKRGGVSGEWHDLIDNENICTLVGNYTELENGVSFPNENNCYGVLNKSVQIPYNLGTVEYCLQLNKIENTGRPVLTMGNGYMGGSFASDASSNGHPAMRWYCYGNMMYYYIFSQVNSAETLKYTASANNNIGICNGTNGTVAEVTNWSTSVKSRIASRGTGNPFVGTLYAIRLYNRLLTHDEMIHNQIIDNKRFDLGIII